MSRTTLGVALATGVGFGFGLAYSRMIRPEVVLDFLRFRDLGLLLVLGGAVIVVAPAYRFLPKLLRRPVVGGSFGRHTAQMSRETVGGAALFGIGWGIGGVCPGPAIAGLGTGNWPILVATLAMFAGAYVQGWLASRRARDRQAIAPPLA